MITRKLIEDNLYSINQVLKPVSRTAEFLTAHNCKDKVMKNALKHIAPGCSVDDVIALWDNTLFSSGKSGFLLAADGLYSNEFPKFNPYSRSKYLPFAGLVDIDRAKNCGYNEKDRNYLAATYTDGHKQVIYCAVYGDEILTLVQTLLDLAHPAAPIVPPTPKPVPVQEKPRSTLPAGGFPEIAARQMNRVIRPDFLRLILPYDSYPLRALHSANPVAARHAYTRFYNTFTRCLKQDTVQEELDMLLKLLAEPIEYKLPAAYDAMACLIMSNPECTYHELLPMVLGEAVKSGTFSSGLMAGYCYRYGIVLEQDKDAAFTVLLPAALGGLGDAYFQLAQMNYQQATTENELDTAWMYYCQAAEHGSFPAAFGIFASLSEEDYPDLDWKKCAASLEYLVQHTTESSTATKQLLAGTAASMLTQYYDAKSGEEALANAQYYTMCWITLPHKKPFEVEFGLPPKPEPVERSIDEFVESDSTPEQKEKFLSSASREYLFILPEPRYLEQLIPESDVPEAFQNNPGSSVYAAALELLQSGLNEEKTKIMLKLLDSAAQLGSLTAQNALAAWYLSSGIPSLAEEAFRLADTAAANGFPLAALNAGWCYEFGLGTQPNMNMATLCYLLASRSGVGEASIYLARCYAFGKFVEKDERLAWRFICQAADQGEQAAALLVGRVLAKGKNPGVNPQKVIHTLLKIVEHDKIGDPVIDPEVSNALQALKYLLNITVDTRRWRDLELGQMIVNLALALAPELGAEYSEKIAELR